MNSTKLRVLADAIESAEEDTFDMSTWFSAASAADESPVWTDQFMAGGINHSCGTAGCIAGWTCNIFMGPGARVEEEKVEAVAKNLLEADGYDERDLLSALFVSIGFWERNSMVELEDGLGDVTQEMAATMLREMADRVDDGTHLAMR